MFSGIVETTSSVFKSEVGENLLRIYVERPSFFDDLKVGDSVSTDGVCLTLEAFDRREMRFALGPETLQVTGWTARSVQDRVVNLERSLRLQDRIHGHLVTGHVDAMGRIAEATSQGESLHLRIEFPTRLKTLIWPKGSVAINGVSLTVNRSDANFFTVGLIPETLKRTNLGRLKVADTVCLEADNMARGLVNWARHQQESQ